MTNRLNLRRSITRPIGIALALHCLAGTAIAQLISFDNKPRPGSPVTGWSGNFSLSDPYSEGPGKGAWITTAGLSTPAAKWRWAR